MIWAFLAGLGLGLPLGVLWIFLANNFVRAGRQPRRYR